jgi:hypothetical protein
MIDRMPSTACFSHALVLNDFLHVREIVPDRMPRLNVNRAQYYLGCVRDYASAASLGADLKEEIRLLLDTLDDGLQQTPSSWKACRSPQ